MTQDTARLREILRDRYPPPDWCMAFEVQAPREDGGLRFADAIAFDTRKFAGMQVHGFELKVSRADWLNEHRQPEKAMAARNLCDYWWNVAGSPGIFQADEGFAVDGLLEVRDGSLVILRHATRRSPEDFIRRDYLDRSLVAAVMRRLDPMEPRIYWERQVRAAQQKGYAKGQNAARRQATTARLQGRPARDDGMPLDLP